MAAGGEVSLVGFFSSPLREGDRKSFSWKRLAEARPRPPSSPCSSWIAAAVAGGSSSARLSGARVRKSARLLAAGGLLRRARAPGLLELRADLDRIWTRNRRKGAASVMDATSAMWSSTSSARQTARSSGSSSQVASIPDLPTRAPARTRCARDRRHRADHRPAPGAGRARTTASSAQKRRLPSGPRRSSAALRRRARRSWRTGIAAFLAGGGQVPRW